MSGAQFIAAVGLSDAVACADMWHEETLACGDMWHTSRFNGLAAVNLHATAVSLSRSNIHSAHQYDALASDRWKGWMRRMHHVSISVSDQCSYVHLRALPFRSYCTQPLFSASD